MAKTRLLQIAFYSEWAINTFFASLKDPEIAQKFKLTGVSGLERNIAQAVSSLSRAIAYREAMIPTYVAEDKRERVRTQIKTANELLESLRNGDVKYFSVSELAKAGENIKDIADMLVIHSSNPCHLDYMVWGSRNGLDVLVEKPTVTVLDKNGKPSREKLDRLICLNNVNSHRIIMNAEHYAYKQSAMLFYKNLEQMLGGKKIKRVVGEVLEIDEPNHPRTKHTLSLRNETGILTDTGVHLLDFISRLGGRAVPTNVKFDSYPGYDVETYAEVKYDIQPLDGHFAHGATAEIRVGKFIDKTVFPTNTESKFIRFEFDETDAEGNPLYVQVNLNNGGVVEKTISGEKTIHDAYPASKNEYVNILRAVDDARTRGKMTGIITPIRDSVTTLTGIVNTYEFIDKVRDRIHIYKDPHVVRPVQIAY